MLKLEANTASSSVIHQVLFAVKPQNTTSLFKKLHGRVPKDAVILSIIAGVPVEDYVEGLGHRKVVRSMPNTPATVRQGMTVWCCTSELCEEERDSVGRLLGTMGLQQYVSDETYLDMATAVSGSGPAYVLLVIEALIDSSVHMGFPRDMATKLVLQTVSPGHCLFGPTPLTSALACVYLMRPWCAYVLSCGRCWARPCTRWTARSTRPCCGTTSRHRVAPLRRPSMCSSEAPSALSSPTACGPPTAAASS